MNLIKVLDLIKKNKGVTYNLVTGETNPDWGYMVAKQGYEKTYPFVDESVIKEYVNSHSHVLCEPHRYLGVWFDGTNFVFDISEIFAEKRNALFFGIVRNQKAIWDNKAVKEIRIAFY